jgi:hypothetical protein
MLEERCMISPEERHHIGLVTSLVVTQWRAASRDDDTRIRSGLRKFAAEAIAASIVDPWDAETLVTAWQHGIDRALEQNPRL